MRTDCKIDKHSVKCVNASTLGHNRWVASVGDLIVFKEHYMDGSYGSRTGRMVGRVSAPKLSDETREVKGFLLVMAFSQDLSFLMERWVDPADVLQVTDVPSNMLAFFARAKLPDADILRRAGEYGSLMDHYIANTKGKYAKELGYSEDSKLVRITTRQLATVLAALRYWQQDLNENEEPPMDEEHFATEKPLNSREIDKLCEQFNLGLEE